ncbi:MAG: hypothetical protein JST79_11300 [Acidobacteria bacterium]|nr:hypothetical protein [Acidobacteriota bacterium]
MGGGLGSLGFRPNMDICSEVVAARAQPGRCNGCDLAGREILSYSRSRGLFAGISLEGTTLRPDNDGNEKLDTRGGFYHDGRFPSIQ